MAEFTPRDSKSRCAWCLKDDLYVAYHDNEWGNPVRDDRLLFEFLILESFQAGLSWHTVLKKRENFRKAFTEFDVKNVAKFNAEKVELLMQNEGIIRNRLKIEAAINNANRFIEVQKEFGSFSNYIWQFTEGKPIVNHPKILSDIPATTPISDAMSKDMGKRGFKFRGSTICYAFMQAVGLVDDHLESCWRKKK
ncbi:MAG: DNA-3-methyladenine glycosylase I [Chitinophagales bacterium]|nr:DNA-3-methyladenine glycosylase I [Chitinophagales bacterium]MCO5270780.1 DNA-3-methyladenine glycosylase I [Cyclobacteriaceae bacterium]MCO5281769.1 DNA-3-methyladenine glycosylase I [Chitinophagales bacterium]HRN95013.1 DNA-3-methyladenine glycosylase I [Chitinophagales bacterium]HRP39613.1 DNA-3-methyladenine glycosylase I [Chitinophagales bacterium]